MSCRMICVTQRHQYVKQAYTKINCLSRMTNLYRSTLHFPIFPVVYDKFVV